jgi:phosphate transport system substrate-binding protein
MQNHRASLSHILTAGIIGLGMILAVGTQAATVTGAGATFPYPIYAKWAAVYKEKTGNEVNYQSIGSGAGIEQIQNSTVDFGASDAPLTPPELNKAGLMQFPTVIGGVVPVFNLEGFKAGEIKLDGPTLADIYLGKITQWNDPAIQKLNPGVKLPDQYITVVHRSDGSGTTFIFTNYLAKVSPTWGKEVGVSKSIAWPTGVGGKGNEGVASYVQRIDGGIGYVEYAYALQTGIPYAQLKNKAGAFVEPNNHTFQAAAADANWANSEGFYVILTNQPGKETWPITGATFILMHEMQRDPKDAKVVLGFFDWAYKNGDAMAKALHYVPMPDNVVRMVEQAWSEQMRAQDGGSIWNIGMVQK